ncbi:MAG: hypothetical protein OEZ39_17485 [Gammaproteobacteria bacterium]|nr:hypothetical protein [Gammaproteobacteria bacterium]MDH5653657.1 hypothetical protein [Gammaproteobacteria bacterium]
MKLSINLFGMILLCSLCRPVMATGLWQAEEYATLCQQAVKPDKTMLAGEMGDYLKILQTEDKIDIDKIRIPATRLIEAALDKAISLNWAALEFFTEPNFAGNNACMVFMTEAMLQAVDKKYNLHTLWMINAPYDVDDEGKGKIMPMKFLLMGRGKLIVGYKTNRVISVKDYPVFTGRYDYTEYTSMDIINKPNQTGVFNIKSWKSAAAGSTPFYGPANAEILSMEIALDNREEILIKCRETWVVPAEQRVDRLKFEVRQNRISG